MDSRTGHVLYPGPELRLAAERSSPGHRGRVAAQGAANATATLLDLAWRRLRRKPGTAFRWTLARGADPVTGGGLAVLYAGDGSNEGWCLGTAFADPEVAECADQLDAAALARRLAGAERGIDLLFLDVVPATLAPAAFSPILGMPAWVKQRIRVLGDWRAQVEALRRETRQEAARLLRRHRYRSELTREPQDLRHFHDELYRPYVTRRFGASAHLVERDAFLRQCRRGTLLRIFDGDRLLGASLLRPQGRTMAVVWSALDPVRSAAETRGATDALDYFSLLYAHLQGSRWLDLGPSRPDLCDGVLRYKAKWGGEVHPGLVPQPVIRLFRQGRNPAVRHFLERHLFLERAGRGLRALVAADGVAAAQAKMTSLRTPGIDAFRIVGEAVRG